MALPAPAVALALGARPVSAADPHLVVLGVLVAAWVIDRVLAAVEWLRGAGGGDADGPPGSRAGTGGERRGKRGGGPRGKPGGGPTGDSSRLSGDASRPRGAE